ncbi:hypothetical protein ColTof4_02792 [Colletotrichum tofieldiae]|nr:hypothetical protein ColTof3_08911 [Colletotrichum tofieldiae]GKT70369.1 hypothetical protein ColTof4_02792 [Colletotrichum tofieldiae]GKT93431.1 hypothetical protein Ct61P_11281 [Colletotrichum tofieldiae]
MNQNRDAVNSYINNELGLFDIGLDASGADDMMAMYHSSNMVTSQVKQSAQPSDRTRLRSMLRVTQL